MTTASADYKSTLRSAEAHNSLPSACSVSLLNLVPQARGEAEVSSVAKFLLQGKKVDN